MDVERRLEVAEQENLFLRERIASLEAILMETARLPIEWQLTAQETRVFGVLVKRELATKDAIMAALYAERASEDEIAEPKITDVFICKIRKKLRPFGIEIQTIWGQGWSIRATDREAYHPRSARAA